MTNSTGSFIWYELMTADVIAAKRFYDSVVGWSIASDPAADEAADGGADGIDYRMIARGDGGFAGGVLALTEQMQSAGARPGWLGYIAVADVDHTVAAIVGDGGAVHMPANTIDGIGRMALVADPQGAAFYLMTPTPPPGMDDASSDAFSVDQPQHVRWNELTSADPEALAFYGKHFGWSQAGAMDMGRLGQYRFIQHGGVGIGAVMPLMPGSPASAWTYYIGVDDIDRANAAIEAGGGTVMRGPMQIPGGEYSLTALDPHGAAFGLVGPRRQ